MPHYQDGTEAKIGDHVKFKDWSGIEKVGQVGSITPSETCNANIHYVGTVPSALTTTATLKDCSLVHRPA